MFDLQLTRLPNDPHEVGEIVCHDKVRSFIGVTLSDDDSDKSIHQLGYVCASAKDVVKMGSALLELLQQMLTMGEDDSLYYKLIIGAAYEIVKKHRDRDLDTDDNEGDK